MRAEPVADAPTVLVVAVGDAEGARPAAAALACAGADVDRATLLVDFGGRAPRPTLLASAAARGLEERLAAHLPEARIAARGQTCHLAVPADRDGVEVASAAVTVSRGALSALHVPAPLLRMVLDEPVARRASAALLRADVAAERPLLALLARELMARDLRVAVLKRPLSWVASRRALFGALPPDAPGALPATLLRRLGLEHACYGGLDDSETDPAAATQRKRRDHAGARSR